LHEVKIGQGKDLSELTVSKQKPLSLNLRNRGENSATIAFQQLMVIGNLTRILSGYIDASGRWLLAEVAAASKHK